MLWAILNKSWKQHPTKQHLYDHLPLISKTIQIRWTRYAGHCWRNKDELISYVLLWTPSYRWACVGWPVRTIMWTQDIVWRTCRMWWTIDINGMREREAHTSSLTWWYIFMTKHKQYMMGIFHHSNKLRIL